ncbi:MAG: chemotaxis protein CheW [Thermomonas sp.]
MSHSHSADAATLLQANDTSQEYLTFTLGDEEYGVEILKVQEIRGYESVTRLPDAADYIKGVINLRGIIVPVVDMRLKFQIPAEYTGLTVMIVLNVGERVVGMVVDSVSDVVRLGPEQIRDVPELGATIDGKFLTGLGTFDERMLILLDIEQLMTSAEMGLVAEAPALAE